MSDEAKPRARAFEIMPDGARVIHLETTIKGHEGPIKKLTLRPPGYAEYMELGDPTALIMSSQAMIPQDDFVAIKAYAERLSDVDPLLMTQLNLRDSVAIADAVKSFFLAGSPTTSTASPIS